MDEIFKVSLKCFDICAVHNNEGETNVKKTQSAIYDFR